MSLWTPGDPLPDPTPRAPVVDTPIAAILRDRHIERLQELADDFLDEAAAAAIAGRPKTANYLEQYWVPRIQGLAATVAAEPLIKALNPRLA